MTNIFDIRSYRFTGYESLFVDANVWLSFYGPVSYRNRQSEAYSSAWRRVQKAGCKVFVDVLVLSEFINRFAREAFEQLTDDVGPERYKDYRDSAEFKQVAQEIEISARKIVSVAKCCDSGLPTVDLGSILGRFGKGCMDFNDQIITEICKSRKFVLVTHDGDFSGEVMTLTANARLLSIQ